MVIESTPASAMQTPRSFLLGKNLHLDVLDEFHGGALGNSTAGLEQSLPTGSGSNAQGSVPHSKENKRRSGMTGSQYRAAVKSGKIIPGWRKGTKIKFSSSQKSSTRRPQTKVKRTGPKKKARK